MKEFVVLTPLFVSSQVLSEKLGNMWEQERKRHAARMESFASSLAQLRTKGASDSTPALAWISARVKALEERQATFAKFMETWVVSEIGVCLLLLQLPLIQY
jgi:hypothetical protein